MKISLQWLKKYVALEAPAEELAQRLPMIGHEVASVEQKGMAPMANVVVGEVLVRDPHPNADKLSVCQVRVAPNAAPLQIVCGAQNYKVGDRVPVAVVGAKLPGDFKIKKSKLRGVDSEGMMCSARELGLGADHGGLLILENRPEIGTPINDVFTDNDAVLEVELTANRGDCLSLVGMARELGATYGLPVTVPTAQADAPRAAAPDAASLLTGLSVETADCPYYTAWSIRGVKVGPSPDWLKRDLEAVGLRAINNVVDVTNWVMLELGQPLHAFDAAKIRGRQIVVRQARAGEKITTLDGKARDLDPSMMVIADAERPLVVAGIMGSVDAEVDGATTDIVLESAYFVAGAVRRASRKLTLSTDSSHRFTRDVDPQGVAFAARRAIDLILLVAGGTLSGPAIVHGAPTRGAKAIETSGAYVRQVLGFDVSDALIRQTFERLGFAVADAPGGAWSVTVPSSRGEVARPVDLAEEFLRIYGTDKIPESPVLSKATLREDDGLARFTRRAADYLAGQHFNECYHYSLRDSKELTAWHADAEPEGLALANPLTSDQSHLRPSLIPGLLDGLKLNLSHGNDVRRLFEIGRVFRQAEGRVYELVSVAFVLPQVVTARTWKARPEPDYALVKGIAQRVLSLAGQDAESLVFEPVQGRPSWQEGHAAVAGCYLKNKWQVKLGLLNVKMTKALDLATPVLAAEVLLLPSLLDQPAPPRRFAAFSPFPPVTRDLALVVDSATLAETVRRDLEAAARKTVGNAFAVESVTVFDVYTGTGLPEGKKSLAFALVFRSMEKTLSDDAVNPAFTAIQQAITSDGRYAVRS